MIVRNEDGNSKRNILCKGVIKKLEKLFKNIYAIENFEKKKKFS